MIGVKNGPILHPYLQVLLSLSSLGVKTPQSPLLVEVFFIHNLLMFDMKQNLLYILVIDISSWMIGASEIQ